MDTESMTRSQPTRETLKRALFISPDHRKGVPQASSSSVPAQAMKSKRALFGSPVRAETKSADGSQSDQFLKRKLDAMDDAPETSRSKIAKSLSFGGDSMGNSLPASFSRRASESFINKNMAELNETHKHVSISTLILYLLLISIHYCKKSNTQHYLTFLQARNAATI